MRPLNEIRNYMGNYHVKSGVYHYYRNEYKQALGFLRKALSDEATLGAGDLRVARCYLALSLKGLADKLAASGELEAALGELDNAAEVRGDFPDLHYERGVLLERLGRPDEALAAYRRALERHPDYVDAAVALAACLAAAGRPGEAAAAFEEAFRVKVERMKAPFDRGLELLRADDAESALERMHEVFRSAPRMAEFYLRQALDYMKSEEYEKALIEFDRAIELSPSYPDLHNFRGIALCESGRAAEAVAAFGRAARLSPDQLVPRLNLAFAHVRANQPGEAQAELESILRKDPHDPVATAKLEELRQAERRGTGVRPGGS